MYKCPTCGAIHGSTTTDSKYLQVGGVLVRQRLTPACAICYTRLRTLGASEEEAWRAAEMRPWAPPFPKPKKRAA